MKVILILFAVVLSLGAILGDVHAQDQPLETRFKNPPSETKPLTWFHVMSGNMSEAGLTKDLESIAEVGIGGTILFNVTQGIPLGPVKFNSEQHIDLIGHMAKESKRLGLSFGVHNCDGWTASGGPWITPEHSMKKVVWNEVLVDGGDVNITLSEPASLLGYYEDIATIAYPALMTEITDAQKVPKITASDKTFDPIMAADTFYAEHTSIEASEAKAGWLQFEYDEPYTLRFIEMLIYQGRRLELELYTSSDGIDFKPYQILPLRRPGKHVWALDATVEPVTARYFRIYTNLTLNVQEVKLSSTPAMVNYLGRTSAARTSYDELEPIGSAPDSLTIKSKTVRDLTHFMSEGGQINTTLPPGKWTIMRFGYTTTGAINIPASKEGTGLEVDKFSRAAFDVHYGAYVTNVLNKTRKVAPGAIQTLEIDSYEVGGQNWTKNYEAQFKKKYKYNLISYLPLFAGKFVDSPEVSEAVLWDTRDLYNQLIKENYFGYFTELAHRDGVRTYIEPYGFGPFNDVDAGSKADIPMGEFWLKRDVYKLSAASSAAHIYDKNIISAEAFTAKPEHNWRFHPAMGKYDGDKSWALGVNELVFHRFAHQANTHVVPGMTMNRWGTHFDRTQTWWENAGKDWFKYMARGQFLLRQGKPVSDVLLYLGDASPTSCPEKDDITTLIPLHINYDCLNSDVLKKLKVKKGKLVLPSGASYKAMVLKNHLTLSDSSLKAIYRLAKKGAVIVGKKIQKRAGLNASEKTVKRFSKMTDDIWKQKTTYSTASWDSIYAEQGFNYDLRVKGREDSYYAHRKTEKEDIYFLFNSGAQKALFDVSFDVNGKAPELWYPMTGETEKVTAFQHLPGGQTQTQFLLNGHESVFVVFRERSKSDDVGLKSVLDKNNVPDPLILNGPWEVAFNKQYGLDKVYPFEALTDWRDHPDVAVRSYSGTAEYTLSFEVPAAFIQNKQKVKMDLGRVSIAATVTLNGREVGTTWIAPYRLDVTDALQVGTNHLKIEVANLWVNRLIADESYKDTSGYQTASWYNPSNDMPLWYMRNQAPPKSKRFTFTTQPFFKADDPLVSSGLLGPVTIHVEVSAFVSQQLGCLESHVCI